MDSTSTKAWHYSGDTASCWPLIAGSTIVLFLATPSLASAAQTDQVAVSVQCMSDAYQPIAGVPVELSQPGLPAPLTSSTDIEGQTEFMDLQGSVIAWATLSETSVATGKTVGMLHPFEVADYDSTVDATHQLIGLSQPIAETVFVASDQWQQTETGPSSGMAAWWNLVTKADADLNFRCSVAPLLSQADIDACLGYLGYGSAPFSYTMGVYIESRAIDLGSDLICLDLAGFGKGIPADAVVDLFEFTESGGVMVPPISVSVADVDADVDALVANLSGKKSAGKVVLLVRSGSSGPPISHHQALNSPNFVVTLPSSEPGNGCVPCFPVAPSAELIGQGAGDPCTPVAAGEHTEQCPDSITYTGATQCNILTVKNGPPRCLPSGGGTLGIKSSLGHSVTVSSSFSMSGGGVGFSTTIGETVELDLEETVSVNFGSGECDCGQCMQRFVYVRICARPYSYRRHKMTWGITGPHIVGHCEKFLNATAVCAEVLLETTVDCDQSNPSENCPPTE